MRFVRTLAAAAILGCSMVAGQAGAVTLYRYTYSPSPAEAKPVSFRITYAKPGIPDGRIYYGRLKCTVCPGIAFAYNNGPFTDLVYESYNGTTYLFGGGKFPRFDTLEPGEYIDPKAGSKLKLETLSFVPEPSTWALMIAGFGAIGAAMRRRVRGRAPALA